MIYTIGNEYYLYIPDKRSSNNKKIRNILEVVLLIVLIFGIIFFM